MSQKVAYVTGGMGGIGTAICQRLHQDGFKVIAGCGPTRDYQKWLDEQKALGFTFYASVGNVGDWNSTVEAFTQAKEEHGSIDVLVNNAGISLIRQIQDTTPEDYDALMGVNCKGVFLCSRAAAVDMLRRHSGAIVNVSSMWGQVGASCETVYSMSKAGVIGFTRALAQELAPEGIAVNCVAPGIIDTRMNACFDRAELEAEVPMGRLGTPREVAEAVLYLAESPYVTGQVLGVNGGIV